MNRFCVAALARLHPICARHKRNIPPELYSTVGGTDRSRPDESVFYPYREFGVANLFAGLGSLFVLAKLHKIGRRTENPTFQIRSS
jgi:hypothetical protein